MREYAALPDPVDQPDFYENTAIKRALAWVVDTIIVTLISILVATLPFFLGWFFFPLIVLVVSFLYRTVTISRRSSTWGMRLLNIELRGKDGQGLSTNEAMLHTAAYLICSASILPHIVSMLLMLINPRGQGLPDMLCGSVMLNRPSPY